MCFKLVDKGIEAIFETTKWFLATCLSVSTESRHLAWSFPPPSFIVCKFADSVYCFFALSLLFLTNISIFRPVLTLFTTCLALLLFCRFPINYALCYSACFFDSNFLGEGTSSELPKLITLGVIIMFLVIPLLLLMLNMLFIILPMTFWLKASVFTRPDWRSAFRRVVFLCISDITCYLLDVYHEAHSNKAIPSKIDWILF